MKSIAMKSIAMPDTPWCVDTPADRTTPRTVHRTTCTGPADGKVVPLFHMKNETEESLRADVAGNEALRLCPTCLGEPTPTDPELRAAAWQGALAAIDEISKDQPGAYRPIGDRWLVPGSIRTSAVYDGPTVTTTFEVHQESGAAHRYRIAVTVEEIGSDDG